MRFFLPSFPAGRLEYLVIMVAMNAINWFAITQILDFEAIDPFAREFGYDASKITTVAFILFGTFAISMITILRRLTSLKMPGMAVLVLFIPIISLFFQLWLLLAKGVESKTIAPYGDNPYDPDSWVAKPAPGSTNGPVVTYQGQALRLPGEETWGEDAA